MNGIRPWFSIDAGADEIVLVAHLPIPEAEDVDRCMNCPYAECRNCMGSREKRRKYDSCGRPRICDIERIRRMVESGRTNREICESIGCSKSTVNRYKRMLVTSA